MFMRVIFALFFCVFSFLSTNFVRIKFFADNMPKCKRKLVQTASYTHSHTGEWRWKSVSTHSLNEVWMCCEKLRRYRKFSFFSFFFSSDWCLKLNIIIFLIIQFEARVRIAVWISDLMNVKFHQNSCIYFFHWCGYRAQTRAFLLLPASCWSRSKPNEAVK